MKFLNVICLALLMSSVAVGQESSLETADGNGDGKVTTKEFKDYAGGKLPGFDKLDAFVEKVDADGNGEIDQKEFEGRRQVLQAISQANEPSQGSSKKSADGPHKVGDKASDFELQSLGKKIKLSDNFGKDGKPVVVVFSRAHW